MPFRAQNRMYSIVHVYFNFLVSENCLDRLISFFSFFLCFLLNDDYMITDRIAFGTIVSSVAFYAWWTLKPRSTSWTRWSWWSHYLAKLTVWLCEQISRAQRWGVLKRQTPNIFLTRRDIWLEMVLLLTTSPAFTSNVPSPCNKIRNVIT